MTWNSLFPPKPWELQWPVKDLEDMTDVWLWVTIGITIVGCLWAAVRTYQAIKGGNRTGSS